MKKRILPILLLISPYLYLLINKFYDTYIYYAPYFYIRLGVFMVITIFITNMIYAFVIKKFGRNSTELLFWDMILKLFNIPIYIMTFLVGIVGVIIPFGILYSFLLLIVDYLLLLTSTMYGVSGLIQAYREKKITKTTAIVNCILHFFFCTDVISAIAMFCIVKAKGKKRTISDYGHKV